MIVRPCLFMFYTASIEAKINQQKTNTQKQDRFVLDIFQRENWYLSDRRWAK